MVKVTQVFCSVVGHLRLTHQSCVKFHTNCTGVIGKPCRYTQFIKSIFCTTNYFMSGAVNYPVLPLNVGCSETGGLHNKIINTIEL